MAMEQKHMLQAFFHHLSQLDPSDDFKLRQKLEKRFIDPPTALFSGVLGPLSDAEMRQLLFAPSPQQMQIYCRALSGDPNEPADLQKPANKVQAVAITHLWLVHGRCWGCMRAFIEAGGLRQLAKLLTHPQPVIAANAMELLVIATHPSMYDWAQQETITGPDQAQPPTAQPGSRASSSGSNNSSSSSGGNDDSCVAGHSSISQPQATAAAHPATGPDAVLWQELFQLQSGPLFRSLLRLSPDVFPSSGSMAIQFLTFYLNWLRTWWCKDGKLQLSTGLLSGLSAWSSRASASAEERQLAAQLLADFGACGPAPGAAEGEAAVSCGSEPELQVVADRTLVNSKPGSEAERLKAAGNDAFKAKDWCTATQLYSDALDLPVPREALLDEGPRRATLHANRAAAYLERYKELVAAAGKVAATNTGAECTSNSASSSSMRWLERGGVLDGLQLDGSSPETHSQLLQAAVLDCKAALDLVPTHTKAHFRLATALKAQGKLAAARAAAQSAAEHASCQAERTAAARLAASIEQQLQQQSTGTQNHQQKPGSIQAQPILQASTTPPQQTKLLKPSTEPADKPGARTASDTVDQLLQQFAAALAPTGTCNSAQQQPNTQQHGKLPGAGHKQAEVLLPLAAQQQHAADQQMQGDQLVIPGRTTACGGSKQHRPLIQELPPASS